ncbi:MAG: DNA-binding response regulator [Alphaproteobacteria bacterium 64-11]|nr:response regulator transcription factor [Alphaproteobacteria bacterium]OJU10580.1 MAG: DNA-binding response regulator [Alphaproteobacteria bacterium 64-11]
MSRILVVDDHAIVRSGIRRLLKERENTEVVEAAGGEEALEAVQASAIDLILLDLNLPAVGGLELLRRLLRAAPGTAVLIFSQHSEAIYAAKALEAGARGFVSKNAMPEELLEAVDAILAGGTAVEKDIQREMAIHDVMEDAYLKPLSERDLEILRLLASGNTLSEIAGKLGVAYKTVANTLSRIKEKLGVGQTSDLIRIAVSRGLTDLI